MKMSQNVKRLCVCKSISDCMDCLVLFSQYMWAVIESEAESSVTERKNHEARLMFQMMFTKVLHLKEILNGVSFSSSRTNYYLNTIIDPGVIAIMSRNMFETVGLFNLIYRQPNSEDEQDLVYNLWRHAGLKNRQRFEESFDITDRQSILESEKQDMREIVNMIRSNSCFLNLDEHNQDKIEKRIEKGEYSIYLVNKKVKVLHWQSLATVMGIKKELFDNIYSYFSLYAHPSNVSVSQFDELFSNTEQGYLEMCSFNIKTTLCMIGIFIADYINYFPKIGDVYNNNLDIEERVVIDFHNRLARGEKYSIIDVIGRDRNV